jgi:hypothetical protein
MQRLDVCEFRGATQRGVRFVLVLQRTSMLELPTILVAPLISIAQNATGDVIRPAITIDGVNYRIEMLEIAALKRRDIGPTRINLAHLDYSIGNALDSLLFGP